MTYEQTGVDELISDIHTLISDEPQVLPQEKPAAPAAPAPAQPSKKKKKKTKRPFWKRLLAFLGGLLLFILETVLLLAVGLYGVMYIVVHGPSPAARDLFVRSVNETSAVGFLANIYLPQEEIDAILYGNSDGPAEYVETDVSLIQIPTDPTDPEEGSDAQGPQPDAWGLVDEDGDGIILQTVTGEGYIGYMMVVLDPSRVIMACRPSYFGVYGLSVENYVRNFDAVAGINAGGFDDPSGTGNGSIPNTLVVYEGKVYYPEKGVQSGFVGLDSNHILHVASSINSAQIQEKDIQYGVCFGPVLVSNGVGANDLASGINPRTGIGQRSDGAILMLVIEGRQVSSMGATFQDMADIFLEYGAVNALNLDGGSSSVLWYEDRYVNNSSSIVGIRPVPTSFLVMPEGVESNG